MDLQTRETAISDEATAPPQNPFEEDTLEALLFEAAINEQSDVADEIDHYTIKENEPPYDIDASGWFADNWVITNQMHDDLIYWLTNFHGDAIYAVADALRKLRGQHMA